MDAAYNSEWADFVWYKNMLGENNVDDIFCIEHICSAVRNNAQGGTYYGNTNRGTTIQLPFGFVQWHQKKLQFHHSYYKLTELCR